MHDEMEIHRSHPIRFELRRNLRHILQAVVVTVSLTLLAGAASAQQDLLFQGKPVHPACLHALVTQAAGNKLPVTLSVSLAGCTSSAPGQLPVTRSEDAATISDDELIGPGSFGYRSLSRLENGIYAIGVRRTDGDGNRAVSLAAVDLVERPMIRNGMVIQVPSLELLGLVPLPKSQVKSFRRVGNKVQVKVGMGPNAFDRVVDLTELGKALKKRKR